MRQYCEAVSNQLNTPVLKTVKFHSKSKSTHIVDVKFRFGELDS